MCHSMNRLALFSVCKKFLYSDEERTIFSNLTYEFTSNTSYAIMAPSGIGKSTLLHLLAGIDSPTSGTILLNKKNVICLKGKERACNIGLVLQSSHFINELTVHENCAIAGIAIDLDYKECFEKSYELLNAVGLESYLTHPVGSLSGGQRQRLALIRTLMCTPTFLIADEITGNLDNKTANTIIHLLLELQKKYHYGLILTTHDSLIASCMDIIVQLSKDTLIPINKNILTPKGLT